MARATWDTGWFQAEVVRELLIELGYEVSTISTMENQEFYTAVASSEVDLWANGWFPLHQKYLDNLDQPEYAAPIGYQVRQGALEGYLVDTTTAERLGIGITSRREELLDFSHAYFKSGLQILVRAPDSTLLGTWAARVKSVIFTRQLLYVTGLFLFMLLVSAHAIWLFERRHNPDFPRTYVRGIGEAFWWAAVTVTTVGYGDTTPKRTWGKAFALFWMFAGYFVFAYFTASVASSFTVRELQGTSVPASSAVHLPSHLLEHSRKRRKNGTASALDGTLPGGGTGRSVAATRAFGPQR